MGSGSVSTIEAQHRFELLSTHSRDIILFIRRDDGCILEANAAATSAYGYSRAELRALTIHHLRAPETQALTADQMARADAEGILFETTHLRKDGSTFPVEVSSQGATIGGVRTLISVVRDISERKRAEEERERLMVAIQREKNEAQHRTEELHAIIDALYDPVLVYGLDGVIYRANASAVRAHGFDPSHHSREDTNRTLIVRHPDGSIAHSDELPSARALQGETVIGEPLELTNAQGRQLALLVTSTPLIVNGVQTGAVSIWNDVTEHRQVERALGEAHQRAVWLARLPEENPNPVARVAADGCVLYHNPAAAALPGWTCVVGQPLPDLLLPMIEQAMRQGQKVQQDVQLAGLFYSVTIMPFLEEAYANLYALDITERKQAERALRASEERFRQLADAMPQLVWTARPDGTVDYYNQRHQEYGGIARKPDGNWQWAPVLHPDDRQPTVDAWLRSVAAGEIYQMEHRVQMADGSFRWHLSRGVPAMDGHGRIAQWFGTATDIHAQKLAEDNLRLYAEKLERSNRDLQEFAFIASHDLQEPLRKIMAFGDILLQSSPDLGQRERGYVERMRKAAERMRNMVAGLLQLSRVTTQGQPFVQVDLTQVVAEVLSDLDHQIRRTGGRVEVCELPVVEGDPLQLHQLLQNLIGNALKFHQSGIPPFVKIFADRYSASVHINVADNGIGFDQKEVERILQPFQRLVGRDEYEGTGMGLAICRRIVERHGGKICARSEPGQGATFIVTLPANYVS